MSKKDLKSKCKISKISSVMLIHFYLMYLCRRKGNNVVFNRIRFFTRIYDKSLPQIADNGVALQIFQVYVSY